MDEIMAELSIIPTWVDPILGKNLNIPQLTDDNIVDHKCSLPINTIACDLSHRKTLMNFIDSGASNCLILEDDIEISDSIDQLQHIMDSLPDNCDILYLGYCHNSCDLNENVSSLLSRCYTPLCGHAYAVTRNAAIKMMQTVLNVPINHPFDKLLSNAVRDNMLVAYCPNYPLFYQTNNIPSTLRLRFFKQPKCRRQKRYVWFKIFIIIILFWLYWTLG
jgi:GR25 family glycosyltransferase involved in LPS biosynthesis